MVFPNERDVIEVEGHKHIHTPTSAYVLSRLGNRLDLVGDVTYDILGNNIAEESNFFCGVKYANWALEHMYIPIITVIVYMLLVYFGQKWMAATEISN